MMQLLKVGLSKVKAANCNDPTCTFGACVKNLKKKSSKTTK